MPGQYKAPIPDYGQLSQTDPVKTMLETQQVINQMQQLRIQKAQVEAQKKAALLRALSGGGAGGISITPGEPRYFREKGNPDAQVVEGYIDKRSAVPVYNGRAIDLNKFEDVTGEIKTRRAEEKAARDARLAGEKAWQDSKQEYYDTLRSRGPELATDLNTAETGMRMLEGIKTGTGGPTLAFFDSVTSLFGGNVPPSSPFHAKQWMEGFKYRLGRKFFAMQKGGLNRNEFNSLMDSLPDLYKTAEGNYVLLEIERAVSNWELRRNEFERSIVAQQDLTRQEHFKLMQDWDDRYSQNIIPADLKQRAKAAQAKAKNVTFEDFWDSATRTIKAVTGMEDKIEKSTTQGNQADQYSPRSILTKEQQRKKDAAAKALEGL